MILGKLKEKQEISQERSVTMVPETRNTNRSGWFPAQLRAITERKPTSLCFPILRQSFLPSFLPPQRSFQTRYQSRSHDSIQVSIYIHPLLPECSDPDLNPCPIPPRVTKRAFSFNFVISKFGGIFPRNLANPKSRVQTNVGRVSEIWLRTSQGFQVGYQLE